MLQGLLNFLFKTQFSNGKSGKILSAKQMILMKKEKKLFLLNSNALTHQRISLIQCKHDNALT